ncbi:MAG: PhnD/SsuA/transferrin family substrate-binding protein [Acidobacteriota bacterium]
MAKNVDLVCWAMVGYIRERLGIPTQFIEEIPWQEREQLFDAGEIDLCWICGLPYVLKADQANTKIELLAAPVMYGSRYQNLPIYFSDVVVHSESRFHSFADLKAARWAYNEPGSHSGYGLVRYHLATLGEDLSFFRETVESGGHQFSLHMILNRQIDASAIDSTVLEFETLHNPEIGAKLRIIATLGPSPIPPLIISKNVPVQLRVELRELLLNMHNEPAGRAILAQGRIVNFVMVQDHCYNAIRHMAAKAGLIGGLDPSTYGRLDFEIA